MECKRIKISIKSNTFIKKFEMYLLKKLDYIYTIQKEPNK